jgi:hypothetical protein
MKKELKLSREWKEKELETREFRNKLNKVCPPCHFFSSCFASTEYRTHFNNFLALYHFVFFEEMHRHRIYTGMTEEIKEQLKTLRSWIVQFFCFIPLSSLHFVVSILSLSEDNCEHFCSYTKNLKHEIWES